MICRVYLFTFFLVATGCASISTSFSTSSEAEFDRYQTFYCLECEDDFNTTAPEYDNEINRELIRAAIRVELEKKNYFYTRENPDLSVDFHIIIEEKSDVIHEAYPMSWQLSEFSSFPVNYQYGTLIIHFVDNNTKQLVWQGTASKVLENPKKAQKTIQRAITKIFQRYAYTALNN